jgi:hypothetical protein
LKAKSFHVDYTASSTTTGVYTIKVPNSGVSPGGSTYSAGQMVTLTNSLAGAAIRYTLDGATPTENDPSIASGSTITLLDDLTLKVKAFKTGCDPSDVVTETYTVTGRSLRQSSPEEELLAPQSGQLGVGRGPLQPGSTGTCRRRSKARS